MALEGIGGFPVGSLDFLLPVKPFPEFKTIRAGQAIPLKFSLGDNYGLDILAAGSPASGPIACGSTDPIVPVEPASPVGASGLSYDPLKDVYNYVWATESAWAGTCRQVVLVLIDGTVLRANFNFR